MSCNDCLNRREFVAKATFAAAVLAALEGCGDGQIGATAPVAAGGGITIKLSDFPGLATVGTLVDVGHGRAAVRTSATAFSAFLKACTHEGTETDVRNNRFECPNHLSIFAADGSVVRRPTTGESIPPLQKLATQFDQAAGTLTIA
jgi:Rieske Fe-S protein